MVVGMKRIKQYGIWLRLLMKRLLKLPVFIGLLLLIPVMGYAVSTLEQGGSSGAVVAVCVEESRWSEQIVTKLQALSADNTAGSSVLQYHFYDSDMEIERAVLESEADCGFVIPGDIAERVMEEDWRNSILVYETNSSSITGMAKERIAGVLFQLYSEECYEAYLEETVQAEDFITDDEAEEIVAFARQAYETHLVDGSTFSFVYERQGEALAAENSDINIDDRMSQEKSDRNLWECIFSTDTPEKTETYTILNDDLCKRTSCERNVLRSLKGTRDDIPIIEVVESTTINSKRTAIQEVKGEVTLKVKLAHAILCDDRQISTDASTDRNLSLLRCSACGLSCEKTCKSQSNYQNNCNNFFIHFFLL